MANVCDICGKGPMTGHQISHSDHKTKRRWMPNLQRVRVKVGATGVRRMRVCTSCLKGNKIQKA